MLYSFPAFSQKKLCEMKIDEFTKVKIVESKIKEIGFYRPFSLSQKYKIAASVSKRDSLYFLDLFPEFLSVQKIDNSSNIMLLFEDGSTLKLVYDGESISDYRRGRGFEKMTNNVISHNVLVFTLSLNQRQLLIANKIRKIRCNAYDYEIKQGEYIQEALNCVSSK